VGASLLAMNDNAVTLQIRPGKPKPTLTLALSRRERELTVVFGRSAPT